MSVTTLSRLRPPPELRFAGSGHLIELRQALERLLREPPHPTQGHRQITLYRHGSSTLALFYFNAWGRLLDHGADAVVTLHLLEGQLNVHTAQGTYRMEAGQILVLAPNVPHDVQAVKNSRMLMTICFNPEYRCATS